MPPKRIGKKVNKKNKKIPEKPPIEDLLTDDEELALENLVFGTSKKSNIGTVLEKAAAQDSLEEKQDVYDFFIDSNVQEDEQATEEMEQDGPAWTDEDQQVFSVNIEKKNRLKKLRNEFEETEITGKEYEERLRSQFEKINPIPEWAKVPADNSSSILASTKPLQAKRVAVLNPDKIDLIRVSDANKNSYSNCVIQTLGFHPSSPVMFTAGLDKTLRLFHIDGKDNLFFKSFVLKDLPIVSAVFSADGLQLILTGRRKHFYVLDLDTGNVERMRGIRGREEKTLEHLYISPNNDYIGILGLEGEIILLSMKTKQLVSTLKMNSHGVSMAFSNDGYLWSLAQDGTVYQWDLQTKECTHKFVDEGCVKATTISVSPNGKWIAVGSSVGVVNLYDTKTALASEAPKPEKAIMNLTTSVTNITFHPSSDLLLIASHYLKDSLKLVHIPTKRVVANWPTSKTPIGYAYSASFSPSGRYVAIGNDKGKVLLYRLKDF
ncbi:U3 snoRNP protein [Boothiomyces sp. JEL0866]|nr:U3 snoRNP protein [Boothiomyces sp. JEL0866]